MKGRRNSGGVFWAGHDNWSIVDPDFDDADGDVMQLVERIKSGKSLMMHVDADSRSQDDVPVPLHSHVPDGISGMSEFFDHRRFFRQRRQDILDQREKDRQQRARWKQQEAVRREEEAKRVAAYLNRKPDPVPFRSEDYAWSDEQAMLNNMRISEPLAKGIARVWMHYVMINEGDKDNATLRDGNVPWLQVWQGSGLVIFERVRSRDRMIAEAMMG